LPIDTEFMMDLSNPLHAIVLGSPSSREERSQIYEQFRKITSLLSTQPLFPSLRIPQPTDSLSLKFRQWTLDLTTCGASQLLQPIIRKQPLRKEQTGLWNCTNARWKRFHDDYQVNTDFTKKIFIFIDN
jgi:hypothetical protein